MIVKDFRKALRKKICKSVYRSGQPSRFRLIKLMRPSFTAIEYKQPLNLKCLRVFSISFDLEGAPGIESTRSVSTSEYESNFTVTVDPHSTFGAVKCDVSKFLT